jgi:hypothetical protein
MTMSMSTMTRSQLRRATPTAPLWRHLDLRLATRMNDAKNTLSLFETIQKKKNKKTKTGIPHLQGNNIQCATQSF